jgi:hypothetical protein
VPMQPVRSALNECQFSYSPELQNLIVPPYLALEIVVQ